MHEYLRRIRLLADDHKIALSSDLFANAALHIASVYADIDLNDSELLDAIERYRIYIR